MLAALVSSACSVFASTCHAYGDPHWTLPNGIRYDFYALGLYEMANIKVHGHGDVEIQILMARNLRYPTASSMAAVAMKTTDLAGQETTLTVVDRDVYSVVGDTSTGPLAAAATVGNVEVTSTDSTALSAYRTGTDVDRFHEFRLLGAEGPRVTVKAYSSSIVSGGTLINFWLELPDGVVVGTGLCAGASFVSSPHRRTATRAWSPYSA